MIGIVDYGTSNMGSLTNALQRLEIGHVVSRDPGRLQDCDRLMLPGVGAFGHAMDQLRERSLDTFLIDVAASGVPLFGICLGMQLLLDSSEELGQHEGLGIIPGRVVALRGGNRKVHMGWNRVTATGGDSFLGPDSYAYFVHSFQCRPAHSEAIAGSTTYGRPVVAALRDNRVLGVQFHPEKSGDYGLSILKRFASASF